MTRGSLVPADAFLTTYPQATGLALDLAVLGESTTLSGSGEVAILRFRAQGPATPFLKQADLRGADNSFLGEVPVEAHALGQTERPRTAIALGGEPTSPAEVPGLVQLLGARPNPFSGAVEISYRLPAAGDVDLSVFDVSGRKIRTVITGMLAAGVHTAVWDGRTEEGRQAGIGVYFYTLRAGDRSYTDKLYRYR
jgi:hypothetical protein